MCRADQRRSLMTRRRNGPSSAISIGKLNIASETPASPQIAVIVAVRPIRRVTIPNDRRHRFSRSHANVT